MGTHTCGRRGTDRVAVVAVEVRLATGGERTRRRRAQVGGSRSHDHVGFHEPPMGTVWAPSPRGPVRFTDRVTDTVWARFRAQFGGESVISGHRHSCKPCPVNALNGAGERNRTADPVITSDVLYQLSYTSSVPDPAVEQRPGLLLLVEHITQDVHSQLSYTSSVLVANSPRGCGDRDAWRRTTPAGAAVRRPPYENGATPQNRTGDTRIFSAVLYQLS